MNNNEQDKKSVSRISSTGPKHLKKNESKRRCSKARANRQRLKLPKSSHAARKNRNPITISIDIKIEPSGKNLDIPEPENDEIPNRPGRKGSKI